MGAGDYAHILLSCSLEFSSIHTCTEEMHAHLPAEETPLFGMLAVTEVSFPGQYSDVPAVPSAVVRVHSRRDKYGGKAPEGFLGA